jgi:DNA polymerase-1
MQKPKLDNNTVYLIDGSGYIFRAYFAVRSLHSKKGVPTNAVFGFTTMLIKLIREHKPNYLAIAFDRKEPTFRHKIYPAYKANRPEPPADLVGQFALIHSVVDAFRIPRLDAPGFEADDLIGTMAKKASSAGHEVVIVTGDKDLMQLVGPQVFLLDELRANKIGSELFIDSAQVKEQMGVYPNEIIDLLALAGDSSDNVPGVMGIGKKTAADLIGEYSSLENIYASLEQIKQESRRNKLLLGKEDAFLSKKLVTIDKDVALDCTISNLLYKGIDQKKSREIFSELDFSRLLNDEKLFPKEQLDFSLSAEALDVPAKALAFVDYTSYQLIVSKDQFTKLRAELRAVKKLGLATKIDDIDAMKAELLGLALSWGDNQAAYIPKPARLNEGELSVADFRAFMLELLNDPKRTFVAENAKLHHKVLQCFGCPSMRISGDPMLASYLLHQSEERHQVKDLSEKYFSHPMQRLEKENKVRALELNFNQPQAADAEIADLSLRLEKLLAIELEKEGMAKLYHELELPLEEVLSKMESFGVLLDCAALELLKKDLQARILLIEEQIVIKSGQRINLSSPKQVAELLFEKLGLKALKKTKSGYSTDAFVLERLAVEHEVPKLLLEHRMIAKLINTYVDSLPKLINAKTGRVHTSYNQFVTATGRLSSSDPNLQNIPVRTSEGRRIRQAFIAPEGFELISLDYSQVELRLLAFVSQDPVLLDSFSRDQDVHKRTASEIFDCQPEEVSREQRSIAKTINFGLLYGMGVNKLAESLSIPRKLAQAYLEKYFQRYKAIMAWKTEALLKAKESGEVRTLFGRKRALPDLNSKNGLLRSRAERLAINTPIQGSAADIIKKAMIDCNAFLEAEHPKSRLIMQVHDELVIEAPKAQSAQIAERVSQIMSRGHGLELNLKVDFGIAANWDSAH